MIVKQLDLFGGPLRPPKKIKEDEPVIEKLPEESLSTSIDNEEATGLVEEPMPGELPNPATAEQAPSHIPEATETPVEDEMIPENEEAEWLAQEAAIQPEEPFSELLTVILPTTEVTVEEEVTAELELEKELEAVLEESQEQQEEMLAGEEKKAGKAMDEPVTVSYRGRKPSSDPEEEMEMLNVPPDEALFKRQYYSMRETSAMFNVNQSLLRFWENEFDILQPKKNKKGDRYFRPVDVKNLVLIYHLLRVRKFTLEGAKDYLLTHQKASDSFQLIQRLEKLKSFLFELKANL